MSREDIPASHTFFQRQRTRTESDIPPLLRCSTIQNPKHDYVKDGDLDDFHEDLNEISTEEITKMDYKTIGVTGEVLNYCTFQHKKARPSETVEEEPNPILQKVKELYELQRPSKQGNREMNIKTAVGIRRPSKSQFVERLTKIRSSSNLSNGIVKTPTKENKRNRCVTSLSKRENMIQSGDLRGTLSPGNGKGIVGKGRGGGSVPDNSIRGGGLMDTPEIYSTSSLFHKKCKSQPRVLEGKTLK